MAVTETADASEQGETGEVRNRVAAQDLQAAGLEMEKSWLTVGDKGVSKGVEKISLQAGFLLMIPFLVGISGHHGSLAAKDSHDGKGDGL